MSITRSLLALAICIASLTPSRAQAANAPDFEPGDPLPAQLLTAEGGPVGRVLAPLIGKRPVLAVYWRPKSAPSEDALKTAYSVAQAVAPEAAFLPVAGLAQGQNPVEIREQLAALGLGQFTPLEDTGQFALMVGVHTLPGFVLIDAGGVLRVVGGSDIGQAGPDGLSIAEALALAGKGAPTPTLGRLPGAPIYQLLRRKLPDLAATELDAATWRKLSQYYGGGKRLLLFYWMPTCKHCKKVLPELRAYVEANKPADLNIVDISRGDVPAMREESAKIIRDYPWTHLLDMDRSVSRELKVRETPSVFLISPQGEIVGIRVGESINWERFLGLPAAGASTRRP